MMVIFQICLVQLINRETAAKCNCIDSIWGR